MNIHQFTCKENHVFFLPLELPITIETFANKITNLRCPECGVDSKHIDMHAQQFVAVRDTDLLIQPDLEETDATLAPDEE